MEDPTAAGARRAQSRRGTRTRSGRLRDDAGDGHAGAARRAHHREAVIIEWTDRNIANTTFEGTARELLRMQLASPSIRSAR